MKTEGQIIAEQVCAEANKWTPEYREKMRAAAHDWIVANGVEVFDVEEYKAKKRRVDASRIAAGEDPIAIQYENSAFPFPIKSEDFKILKFPEAEFRK